MKTEQQGIISSGFIILISILVYFFLIPAQVKLKSGARIGPEFFPKLAIMVIGVSALIYMIIQIKNLKDAKISFKEGLSFGIKNYLVHIIFITTTILFLILTNYLGFAISAILFLIFILFFFGSKGVLKNIIIAIVYVLIVYYAFCNILKINFPPGIFGI
ncbi:MAG: hypothetical protein Kow00103_02610 [Candidatus Caldatribacteriota bacterium]